MNLNALPADIVWAIAEKLNIRDFDALSHTCASLFGLLRSEEGIKHFLNHGSFLDKEWTIHPVLDSGYQKSVIAKYQCLRYMKLVPKAFRYSFKLVFEVGGYELKLFKIRAPLLVLIWRYEGEYDAQVYDLSAETPKLVRKLNLDFIKKDIESIWISSDSRYLAYVVSGSQIIVQEIDTEKVTFQQSFPSKVLDVHVLKGAEALFVTFSRLGGLAIVDTKTSREYSLPDVRLNIDVDIQLDDRLAIVSSFGETSIIGDPYSQSHNSIVKYYRKHFGSHGSDFISQGFYLDHTLVGTQVLDLMPHNYTGAGATEIWILAVCKPIDDIDFEDEEEDDEYFASAKKTDNALLLMKCRGPDFESFRDSNLSGEDESKFSRLLWSRTYTPLSNSPFAPLSETAKQLTEIAHQRKQLDFERDRNLSRHFGQYGLELNDSPRFPRRYSPEMFSLESRRPSSMPDGGNICKKEAVASEIIGRKRKQGEAFDESDNYESDGDGEVSEDEGDEETRGKLQLQEVEYEFILHQSSSGIDRATFSVSPPRTMKDGSKEQLIMVYDEHLGEFRLYRFNLHCLALLTDIGRIPFRVFSWENGKRTWNSMQFISPTRLALLFGDHVKLYDFDGDAAVPEKIIYV